MKINKMIYLSHFYNSKTPGYGGKDDFQLHHDRCMANGDKCNQLKFTMSNHVGTHIDLPKHFDNSGRSLSQFSADEWMFTKVHCIEINTTTDLLITSDCLLNIPLDVEFLILKTHFQQYRSDEKYWKNNPGVTEELGLFLKSTYKNLRVLGFDFISATAYQHRAEGQKAHLAFLSDEHQSAIMLLEDMNLAEISQSTIFDYVYISPLLIENADGVPVTVIAKIN